MGHRPYHSTSKPIHSTPADFGLCEAREAVLREEISAEELAQSCLAHISERDAAIGAWAHIDPDLVLRQARASDEYRRCGQTLGRLHGVPIAVKDVIDTADMPTRNGTALDASRRPTRDATIVARLRAAGAVIMGKTVTTELAFMHPAGTRNPHDPTRTPGGSSSGSAAAVAAGMVPGAIGNQTNGSVIRPASFCGVIGFKPTFGVIPRTGILPLSRPLDTVGTFSRSIKDAALLARAIAGPDPDDPDTRDAPAPASLDSTVTSLAIEPRIAFVRSPVWDQAELPTQEAFLAVAAKLGPACNEINLPRAFDEAVGAQRILMIAGIARSLRHYAETSTAGLSAYMRSTIEEGRRIAAVDYLAALDCRSRLITMLGTIFERFDAILTPAAPGEAPVGLETTGNPIFCTLWTLTGLPAISLPLLRGPNELPLGVQVVGHRWEDGKLLQTAQWLTEHFTSS